MKRKPHTGGLVLLGCWLIISQLAIAQRPGAAIPFDQLDSMNLQKTIALVNALERNRVDEAISYFKFAGTPDADAMIAQLQQIATDIDGIESSTKKLVQRSYRHYRDSINIDQVLYYNETGRLYLVEFFYDKDDPLSLAIGIFRKSLALLAQERREQADFKKIDRHYRPAPVMLPPGVFMKENDNQ